MSFIDNTGLVADGPECVRIITEIMHLCNVLCKVTRGKLKQTKQNIVHGNGRRKKKQGK